MFAYKEVRRVAKRILRSLQARGFLLYWQLRQANHPPPVRVLCYHSVPVAEAESFRRQMSWLAAHYDVVPIEHVVAIVTKQRPVVRPTVALTFDDGFRDNFEVVAPILGELRLPATIFVSTAGRTATVAERARADDGPDECWPPRLLMTWDELRLLSQQGFDIELHCDRHRDQSRLSLDELRSDLAKGIARIKEHVGAVPQLFAWPFGRADNRHAQLDEVLHELNIRCAFSGVAGNDLPGVNPYFLYRDALDPTWPTHLVEALLAGMQDMRRAS